MGFKDLVLILLLFCFLVLVHGVEDHARSSMEDGITRKTHLTTPHKHTVKTIKSSVGDIFDCVDINKQPAFDHPLLQNHTIQMKPTSFPTGAPNDFSSISTSSDIGLMTENCPTGTIPIMRMQHNTTFDPISYFRAGNPTRSHSPNPTSNLMLAQLRLQKGKYYGALAELNVYGIPQVLANQFTSSGIWLINDGDGLVSMEQTNCIWVGWMVNPQLFGDTNTRFFIYWTANGQDKGCYNLLCSGFVQVNGRVAIGGVIAPLSVHDGPQYSITLEVFKDPENKRWWLLWGRESKVIGYWPESIFSNLNDHANQVHWGGAVYSPPYDKSPPMGNGHYPEESYSKACFASHIMLVDTQNKFSFINVDDILFYEDPCYQVGYYNRLNGGGWITFGGPGGC